MSSVYLRLLIFLLAIFIPACDSSSPAFHMMCVCMCVCVCVCIYVCMYARVLSCFSCVQLCATLWTVAHQASLSMGFSRQKYWNRLPCPPPGDLPNPGMEPASPALAGRFFYHWAIAASCLCSFNRTNIPPHVYTFLLKCITSVSWMFQLSLKASPPDGLLPLISSLTSEPLCKVTCCCC